MFRKSIVFVLAMTVASPALCQTKSERPSARKKKGEESGLISFVLLRTKPKLVTDAQLTAAVKKAFPAGGKGKNEQPVVTIKEGLGIVVAGEAMLLFHDHGQPYADVAGARSADSVAQKGIDEHKAWLSIDWGGDAPKDVSDAYGKLGRIVAEFADDDTMAIVVPGDRPMIVSPVEGVWKRLRNGEGTDALKNGADPITDVASDDPEMKKAVAEAQTRSSEFAEAYRDRKSTPGRKFMIKGPFRDTNGVEFMWFKVSRINTKTISGVLDNDPAIVKNLKHGDKVSIPREELNDWIIADADGKLVGGFTVNVVVARAKAQSEGKP